MGRLFWFVLCLLLLLPTVAGCAALAARPAAAPELAAKRNSDWRRGIAILGDSFYDEYQGSDRRGGDYAAVTFNAVELLARTRGFALGAWGEWGEPRRTGYQYNWARSGATSSTMIEMGQHLGAAEQVAAGDVALVLIGVGSNDFSPYYGDSYKRIYTGAMSAEGVILVLFMQWELDPTLPQRYPDAARRQRVANAIDAVNTGLLAMASARGAAVVSQAEVGVQLQPGFDAEGYYQIGGERIDFLHHGDEPHHSRLADGQHTGTVMSGVVANYYLIDTINRMFGLAIPRLSDEEILREAGLRP